MLSILGKFFKHFFINIGTTKLKLVRSGGLYLLIEFIRETPLLDLLKSHVTDSRNPLRIYYSGVELLYHLILRILDGDTRLWSLRGNQNQFLYEEMFVAKEMPHRNTFRYFFLMNPKLRACLSVVLRSLSLIMLKELIAKKNIKKLFVGIDQTAREIHGNQENVKFGYHAGKGTAKGFQLQIVAAYQYGIVFDAILKEGNAHSGRDFLDYLKTIVPLLQKLGVEVVITADSGYENIEAMEYLASEKIKFIFAQKQRKAVKKRGKNAKNKIEVKSKGLVYKTRIKETENDFKFTEVFVQAKKMIDENGQLYFKNFLPDEFTNVFITNMKNSPKSIYEYYKQHAIIEKTNEELKNDFDAGISHNESFEFNHAMLQLVAISYVIKSMFIKRLEERYPEINMKKLSTLQYELIHIPAIIANSGNRKILKFSAIGYWIVQKFRLKTASIHAAWL